MSVARSGPTQKLLTGSPAFRALRFFVIALRDFVFPPVCLGCEEREVENGLVCSTCLDTLRRHPLPGEPPAFSDVTHIRALGRYQPPFSSLVHELKYRNRRKLAPVTGEALADLLLSDGMLRHSDLLVPIPLHPARLRERGYNQSELLARQVSRLCNIRMLDGLRRVRNTKDQVKLDEAHRVKNLEGAFAVRDPDQIAHKAIILVDDVTTTGATLRAAARVLREAGAVAVYALVVAQARPSEDRPSEIHSKKWRQGT